MITAAFVAAGAAGRMLATGDNATPPVTVTPTPTVTETPTVVETPSPSPSPTVPSTLGASCENTADGYRLSYPGDWYTVTDLEAWRCSLFDPNPIIVPEFSELPPTAAFVYVDGNRFEDVVTTWSDPNVYETISFGAFATAPSTPGTTVLTGVSLRVRQLQEGFYPAGTRYALVILDLGDRALVAQTSTLAQGGFESNAATLLEIAASVELLA